jgi:hypothetical protein
MPWGGLGWGKKFTTPARIAIKPISAAKSYGIWFVALDSNVLHM